MSSTFTIDVRGLNPVPWTASQASRRKGGVQFFKQEELRNFQHALHQALEQVAAPYFEDAPLTLRLWLWRRLELGTRTATGKGHRSHLADATNMQKAIEDACQGVLFANDRDVREVATAIVDQGPDVEPRIVIMVSRAHPSPGIVEAVLEGVPDATVDLNPPDVVESWDAPDDPF